MACARLKLEPPSLRAMICALEWQEMILLLSRSVTLALCGAWPHLETETLRRADRTVKFEFYKNPARIAAPDVLTSYAASVAAAVESATKRARSSGSSGNGVTSVDVTKLVSFFNAKPGTSEGEVKMFNKNGEAWAYQWSMASQTWIEIGPVVGGDSSKEELDGKEYDRVLPVELEDPATGGTRKLKIGFNNSDNPYVVAQQFIEKHGLSFNHAQDIAEYRPKQ